MAAKSADAEAKTLLGQEMSTVAGPDARGDKSDASNGDVFVYQKMSPDASECASPLRGGDAEAAVEDTEGGGDDAKASFMVFCVIAVISFSPILFGFSLGFTSPAQATMIGAAVHDLSVLSEDQSQIFASIIMIGCMAGSLVGSPVADRFGRKSTLFYGAVPYALVWYGISAASDWRVLSLLRLLLGFFVGIGSVVTPVYIGEIATNDLRGSLGAVNQLMIATGIFLPNLCGTFVFTIKVEGEVYCQWRHLALFGAVLALCPLLLAFLPESPRWLAKHGYSALSVQALEQLRSGDTGVELRRGSFSQLDVDESQSLVASLRCFWHKYPDSIIISVGLSIFQQFSGITAVVAYAGTICAEAGIKSANESAMCVMAAQVIFTGVSVLLMDRAGRRPLLLFASSSTCAALLLLAYYFNELNSGREASSVLAMTGLCLFIVGFALGLGSIPWLILSDVFPTEARATAGMFVATTNWFCAFVITFTFRDLEDSLTQQGTFFLFAVMCAGCFVFTLVRVPETRKKTIEEVLEMFAQGKLS